jgi:hypothetical protein
MREAWFYEIIAVQYPLKNSGFRCPKTFLNIMDGNSGAKVIVMEMIEDSV